MARMVDDTLVHKASNGQPNFRRNNPLGQQQGAGEYFSDQLK